MNFTNISSDFSMAIKVIQGEGELLPFGRALHRLLVFRCMCNVLKIINKF